MNEIQHHQYWSECSMYEAFVCSWLLSIQCQCQHFFPEMCDAFSKAVCNNEIFQYNHSICWCWLQLIIKLIHLQCNLYLGQNLPLGIVHVNALLSDQPDLWKCSWIICCSLPCSDEIMKPLPACIFCHGLFKFLSKKRSTFH